MKKIAVIGGGAAGLTASIYALRANAEVTMFEQFGLGGLAANIDRIDNYPGYISVEGWQLASDMASQAKKLGLKVVRQKVLSLDRDGGEFVIVTDKGEYRFPAVVVATGTSHNKLGIESDYVGKGVSYCATCDGSFYKGLPVAVAGGGNQAVREATYLADLCSKVYVLVPFDAFSAEESAVDNLLGRENVEAVYNATVTAIGGESAVENITVYRKDGGSVVLPVRGLFVAVGATPVTGFINVDGLDTSNGYIVVDGRSESSVKGLFAAGDVTAGALKQIVTACADGAKAGSFASAYSAALLKNK